MQMRQRDVAALGMQIHEEWKDASLKMTLCVMMLPLVVVKVTSRQARQSVREATTPPAIAGTRLADTAERGLFHPQREADHYAKTTGRNPEVY